jgi:hypothetical protein
MLSNKGIFTPIVKTMVIVFKENVKILASTLNVMVTIKNDVASNMAFNEKNINKRNKLTESGKMLLK